MGYQKVYIKTINGFFDFDMRRYKTDGSLKTWFINIIKDCVRSQSLCISDGATCLKNQNKAVFGQNVVLVLD